VFQALHIEHSIATDYRSAFELVKAKRPDVAIIDTELVGGDGFELSRRIKSYADLCDVRVMLVLPSVVTRAQLERVDASGCDDVLASPLDADSLHHHIATVVGLPCRRYRRMRCSIDASLVDIDAVVVDAVEDISLGGVGVWLTGEVHRGQEVAVVLGAEGRTYERIQARVAWRGRQAARYRAGLKFEAIPSRARELLEQLCLFDATALEGGAVAVRIHGDFTESTDFRRLIDRLRDEQRIEFLMREVRYVNSVGVRSWCDFLTALGDKEYTFRHLSSSFVTQVAMMPAIIGAGQVLSFEAPYYCAACDRDDLRLLEADSIVVEGAEIVPPALRCGICRGALRFDDIPERYLAFCRPDSAG
jgi:CheY-like chemotaxis protein